MDEIFHDRPVTLGVYREYRRSGGVPASLPRTAEESDAKFLLSMRSNFPHRLKKLVDLIRSVESGGNVADSRRKLRKRMRKLGSHMSLLDAVEGGSSRDFIMTLFAHLADPDDLRGSAVVEYKHPLSPTKVFAAREDYPVGPIM